MKFQYPTHAVEVCVKLVTESAGKLVRKIQDKATSKRYIHNKKCQYMNKGSILKHKYNKELL